MVTETEAEALLAEQQFIKRHRPRFNIRLRDDKSYPYVGVSLDEEFPRLLHARAPPTQPRLLRAVLEREAGSRDARPAGQAVSVPDLRGPGAGTRSGVPCLDYYIKRCQARRASGTSTRRVPSQHRGDHGLPLGSLPRIERDLEREMSAAAEAQEFERATYRDRSPLSGR